MLVNPLSRSTASGKLTDRRSSHALLRSYVLTCLVALMALLSLGVAPAFAESAWWHASLRSAPAVLPQDGGQAVLYYRALNLGDAASFGNVTLRANLPPGVTVRPVSPENPEPNVTMWLRPESDYGTFFCGEPSPGVVQCTYPEYGAPLNPYEEMEMQVAVNVAPGTSGVSSFEVLAGGAPPVHASRRLVVGEGATSFGVEEGAFSFVPEEEGGAVDAQAGSHPFQLTTNFALNQTSRPFAPPALPKELQFSLPPGLVANAWQFPRCSETEFYAPKPPHGEFDECPDDTAVGVIVLTIDEPQISTGATQTYPVPVFNLTPGPGEPVRFGFYILGLAVPIDFHVRTGRDYGAVASASTITQRANFVAESLTVWGAPGAQAHHLSRGWSCLFPEEGSVCATAPEPHPRPFLTLPTSCREPWTASVTGRSWPLKSGPEGEAKSIPLAEGPQNSYSLVDGTGAPVALTGCNLLSFSPFVEVAPDGEHASSPSGLKVDVKVPQEVSEDANGLASSSVKDITVALPAGVQVNPSAGNGLQSCSEGLVGFEAGSGKGGFEEFEPVTEPGIRTPLFTPTLGSPFCPTQSKIANVEIHSPLIKNPLKGGVYLAAQNENPFGSLVAMYIVAEDPETGVLVKLPGRVYLCGAQGESVAGMTCGAPGQIVTSFENEPQLPFEDASLEFFGGEDAPLATPARCGTYETTAAFVPWSAEARNERSGAVAHASSTFQITSGPRTPAQPAGTPCPGPTLPFAPTLVAGGEGNSAGAFNPLTTTISRGDGEQNLARVTLSFPPGLSGLLSNVALCPEQQANEGKCPASSEIGETTVSAGVGNDPVAVKGGKVYITEKYHGAPFGLSIVNPVKAGPFDLEHDTSNPNQDPACDCIVVRAKIEVNKETAALTVTTNSESEGYAIPHLIDGIPVQIKKVNVVINREHFTFNPTSCNPLSITGLIASDEGASAEASYPFKVHDCASLKFEPKISISTSGKTSKADGASLTVKLSYPPGSMGTDANVKSVKVELPKQLPSRLTTLQKACTAKAFETNPASCPAESVIGHAVVHTQILPVPLEGPAYFVSHGGEAWPNLEIVLQGYGVTVDLVGDTLISKAGITSSTFASTPDVPFENFELKLPQGKYSALAANGNLCQQKLVMPTDFVGQNGATLDQSTHIEVSGCSHTFSFISHSIKRRTLKVGVYAPTAGTIKVSGPGLTSATKKATGTEALGFTLSQKKAGKLITKLKAVFTPAHGKKQSKTLKLHFKK
jgi:hypothetical protein